MNIKTRLDIQYKKLVFKLIASDSKLFTAFHKYLYTPKEGSLSAFIDAFSKNNMGLTVVQIGANDGYNRDPFVKFIKRDNWQGILLEPQPYVYETFLKKLYIKSKRIVPYNYALDYTNGSRTMYKISFSNARWATGLTTFNRDVLEKIIASGHVDGHAQKSGIRLPKNKEDYISEESIETITPNDLLNKEKIKKVDLLAIDTEGFDFEIIKMFDISSVETRVIIYENMNMSDQDKTEAIDYLKQHGYQTKNIGKDTVAMLASDKDIKILLDTFK